MLKYILQYDTPLGGREEEGLRHGVGVYIWRHHTDLSTVAGPRRVNIAHRGHATYGGTHGTGQKKEIHKRVMN